MRPLRLEIEGFTAFRQPVTVDFEGADLFALVGPTGAGKTSILDAITFALYGTVPRLDDRRAVAPIVSQNLAEARVRLDFAVGSEHYTAVRVVRASRTGATTKEARLQRGDEVLAGAADEVSTAVADLLGLTYEHFTTCVSLPQGQFARFLHDKPRDRQDLLVRLLDLGLYDKVATLARQRAALALGRRGVLVGQLDRLTGSNEAALQAAQDRVACLGALVENLNEARPEIDALTEAARAARAQADACAGQVAALEELQAPDGVAELAATVAAAAARRAEAAAAEEATALALAESEAGLAALPTRRALERQRTDLLRRYELDAVVAKGREAAAHAALRLAQLRSAETDAEQEVERRAEELERLRTHQQADALIPTLQVGEACPVCQQPVAAIPALHHSDLTEAERVLAEAEGRLKLVSRDVNDARTEQARVDDKLAGVEAEIAELSERVADDADLIALDAQLDQLDAAEKALEAARAADRAARTALRECERQHEEQVGREAFARRAFDRARDAVAALQPPEPERVDLAADWAGLIAWVAERRPAAVEEMEGQRRRAAELSQQAAGRLSGLVEACRQADVVVRRATDWPGEAVAAAHARALTVVQRLQDDVAEAARLEAEVSKATEERQVAEALAGHLAANRFEKWLLDEAVHRLVAGASMILAELTGGAYALSVDGRTGAFSVIDHTNASQPRPARTLSGGETFLASLALALALADQVAELAAGGVARLESLFLDEGFGTLDADTLDVVATALDELGARGRVVGVVTHVRELAERLPVRFEVCKIGGTATIERIEA